MNVKEERVAYLLLSEAMKVRKKDTQRKIKKE